MIHVRWDDWVNEARLRKLTDENKELAQNLKKDLDAQRRPAPSKPTITSSKKKAAGSDLSSTRGSEERHTSVPVMGRGQKRGRDYEIEKVGSQTSPLPSVYPRNAMSFPSTRSESTSLSSPRSSQSPPVSSTSTLSGGIEIAQGKTLADTPMFPNLSSKTGNTSSETSEVNHRKARVRRKTKVLEDDAEQIVPLSSPPIAQQKETKRRKTSHRLNSSKSTTPSLIEPFLTAEEILSKPAPRDPRSRILTQDHKLTILRTAKKPTTIHPQSKKLNFLDRHNDRRRLFFRDQDSSFKLMIAGVAKEGTLHPLFHPSKARDPMISLSQFGAPTDDPKLVAMEAMIALNSNCDYQEEAFHSRPAIRLLVPDNLKAILVDDWENVTKNLSLVPLPSKTPVNLILDTYFDEEKGKRRLGSAEADLLEEVVAGVKEYFEKCLGRILLYRFEREQFFYIRQLWEAGTGEWEGKGVGDVYGAEHLCRLFGEWN